jgi:hypothetical protein
VTCSNCGIKNSRRPRHIIPVDEIDTPRTNEISDVLIGEKLGKNFHLGLLRLLHIALAHGPRTLVTCRFVPELKGPSDQRRSAEKKYRSI